MNKWPSVPPATVHVGTSGRPQAAVKLTGLGPAGAVGVLTFRTKDRGPQKCSRQPQSVWGLCPRPLPIHLLLLSFLSLRLNQGTSEFMNMQNMVLAARHPPRLGSDSHLLHGATPTPSNWKCSPPSGAHSSFYNHSLTLQFISLSLSQVPPYIRVKTL